MKIDLYSPHSGLNDLPKLLKFVFWGGLNTLLSYGVYCAFIYIEAHIYIASLCSLIFGILLGHYLNKTNVFNSQVPHTLRKYLVLWIGLYFVHIAQLTIFTHFGMNAYIAGIISGGLLVPISFIFQKKIFSSK